MRIWRPVQALFWFDVSTTFSDVLNFLVLISILRFCWFEIRIIAYILIVSSDVCEGSALRAPIQKLEKAPFLYPKRPINAVLNYGAHYSMKDVLSKPFKPMEFVKNGNFLHLKRSKFIYFSNTPFTLLLDFLKTVETAKTGKNWSHYTLYFNGTSNSFWSSRSTCKQSEQKSFHEVQSFCTLQQWARFLSESNF